MKGKILFQSLVLCLCCVGTSCVDSKYDLSDIDTDDLVVGDEWVAPLGTGAITVDDVIKVYKVPSVKIDADGSYVARYEGTLQARKNDLRADEGFEVVASSIISLQDLKGLFDESFKLSLADPHLLLESGLKEGTLDCRMDIKGKPASPVSFFTFSPATQNIWIGSEASSVAAGFTFCHNEELPDAIKDVPETLELHLWGNRAQAAQLPAGALSNIRYRFEAPLAPAVDFEAVTTEHVKDAFDESFVDYIFSGGTATIYGTVTNEMPFDLTIEMLILDESGSQLDISFPLQDVKGASGDVSFEITSENMPKMATARNIDFKMHLKGREKPETLKGGQTISMKLKLKKAGGISI